MLLVGRPSEDFFRTSSQAGCRPERFGSTKTNTTMTAAKDMDAV
jgi:hypothetical protein